MLIENDLSDMPRIQQKRVISRGWESDVEAVGIVAVDIEVEAGVAAD